MSLKVTPTLLPEVLLLEPQVFGDDRGFFYESFNYTDFSDATGLTVQFVQDNHSRSSNGVLRGLHYQIEHAQGKLIRVVEGVIYDVAVDIRRGSPNFGAWVGVELSDVNKRQLWVPPNFAHGFLVVSKHAQVLYKTTDYYYPEHERSIYWNDKELGISWPKTKSEPDLSLKDQNGTSFLSADLPSIIL
jgi:dTDP-4-dehydrorhamnose 3,5-epimerase